MRAGLLSCVRPHLRLRPPRLNPECRWICCQPLITQSVSCPPFFSAHERDAASIHTSEVSSPYSCSARVIFFFFSIIFLPSSLLCTYTHMQADPYVVGQGGNMKETLAVGMKSLEKSSKGRWKAKRPQGACRTSRVLRTRRAWRTRLSWGAIFGRPGRGL